ncbi:SGNH/GDSL hydrolase family protein [Curtobacterium sp. Csp2]|uniref:SGNH/GDSL hydrolase family protein n=1 Tax=Curtobacterium sp. Csp2 TaxID=2495430 RepID=UPI001580AF6A|nr:SGNH/GDSL hydrolase family protein [Curtobacterium sp. Csp2]QKS15673.1 SGNH/GDSL hydrolase family protein [Curtobacterium sp. Csp2]
MGNGFVDWFSRSYKGIIVGLLAVFAATMVVLAMQHVDSSKAAVGATPRSVTYQAQNAEQSSTVAFIGDSYTGGTGASAKDQAFPQVLAAREGWTAAVVACGGGGYVNPGNCGTAYPDHLSEAIDAKPDIVIVSGGRNDIKSSASEVQANATATFHKLREALPNAKLYVTSPIWDDDDPAAALAGIQTAVRAAATATGATYIDIGEPLTGRADLLIDDSIHPNDAGHAAIADAIQAALPKS